MNNDFMKQKPVFPLILSMSMPMVISMLVNSLYNIIDSFFVAKIGENAMTALSLVFPIQNFINAVAIGFGIGINAVISICLGRGDKNKADTAASQGMILSAVHGLVLTAASVAAMPYFLRMFTDDESVIGLGIQYSVIAFSFAPVIMLGISLEKIFQSVGMMKVTMMSMLCGCITNIILDPLLIFGVGFFPKLGMRGAAIATGAGQLLTLVIYIVIFMKRQMPVKIELRQPKPDWHIIGRMYSIGIPAALNLALPSLLISALNAILAVYSQGCVLVLGIYYKLQTFLYLPANGVIQGMRPVIGFNYGAGEYKRVKRIYNVVLAMCAVIMALGTVICLAVPSRLMGLFTENPETVAIGAKALRVISIGFIVSSVSVAASGALEGLGKGVPSLLISLLRYIVIILPLAFLLSRAMGPDGVWHSFWITEVITAVLSSVIYKASVKLSDDPQSDY